MHARILGFMSTGSLAGAGVCVSMMVRLEWLMLASLQTCLETSSRAASTPGGVACCCPCGSASFGNSQHCVSNAMKHQPFR